MTNGHEPLKEPQELRVLADRAERRRDDPPVHARRPGHRGVAHFDWPREDPFLLDAEPVDDHQLGDFLLGREALEGRTEFLPHLLAECTYWYRDA